jgi:hypothetical protein
MQARLPPSPQPQPPPPLPPPLQQQQQQLLLLTLSTANYTKFQFTLRSKHTVIQTSHGFKYCTPHPPSLT